MPTNTTPIHPPTTSQLHHLYAAIVTKKDALILINSQYQITWYNHIAAEYFQIDDTALQRPILDFIPNTHFNRYLHHIIDYPDGITLDISHQPRLLLQLRINTSPLGDFLLSATDITRFRKIEQMRKDFVDNASHELRTPLTVLSGYLETLSGNANMPPQWQRAFDQMQQQTKRMNALVHDLLLLSRLENETLQNKNQIIDMAELINQLFDDAQSYNTDHNHSLVLHIESHYDVVGSDLELASAFGNLITNAIKYTPPCGTITISWQDAVEGAIFSVQDTGIGIAADHLPRLTERFYRVDSGRSRETGGTGLGLAIVKHVLAQHDAHLTIESVEHKGSTFKVIFPKHRLHYADQEDDFGGAG